jgi:hypothetical protein
MTYAPRTWVVGEVVSATVLNQEIRDQFNSMFAAWTAYTPTWTASTTTPVLGNGTLTGRYMKIGRTVICHINLTTGSTSTYGSGNHSFSLPVQAANVGTAIVGNAHLLGTDRWAGQIIVSPNATNISPFFPITATNTRVDFLTATRPEALVAGTQLRMTFTYEAAS